MTSLNGPHYKGRLLPSLNSLCSSYSLLQWLTLHLPKNSKRLERSHPKWGMEEAATLQLSRASFATGCWAFRTSPTVAIGLATTAWNYWRRTWNGGEWSHGVHLRAQLHDYRSCRPSVTSLTHLARDTRTAVLYYYSLVPRPTALQNKFALKFGKLFV